MTNNECKVLHRLESIKAMLDYQIENIREEEMFNYSFMNAINVSEGYLSEIKVLFNKECHDFKLLRRI